MSAPQTSDTEFKQCPNCGTNYQNTFSYCPDCGQKNVASKIKIRELLREFVNSLFNIDARIVVTLRDLWKPAALTIAYFQGHRKKYIHPIRLFLFSLLFLLFGFSFLFDQLEGISTENFYTDLQQSAAQKQMIRRIDSLYRNEIQPQSGQEHRKLDSFYLDILHREGFVPDSIQRIPDSINTAIQRDSVGLDFEGLGIDFTILHRDLAYLSTDEILKKYGTGSFWNDLCIEQFAKAYKNPRGLLIYLIGSITWIYLLLMPVIASFMAILYIRRKRFFVEHLIFSIHVQTIVALLFGISLFIDYWFTVETYIITICLSYLYFALSLKWYYRQGWIKTIVKLIIISTAYLTALTLLILMVSFVRFLLF